MTERETAAMALSNAFRKGIISGLEEYGDTRVVPYPDDIIKEAELVLKEEAISLTLRDAARVRLSYRREGEPPFPEQCPVHLKSYSTIGGKLFVENPRVNLHEALMVSAKGGYLEWFIRHYPRM